jgi:hypothetical protein
MFLNAKKNPNKSICVAINKKNKKRQCKYNEIFPLPISLLSISKAKNNEI